MPVETLHLGLYGPIKTCKTTLGLSFPKPIFHFDLDNGFDRAFKQVRGFRILRLHVNDDIQPYLQANNHNYDIITKAYPVPVKFPGQKSTDNLRLWEQLLIPEISLVAASPNILSLFIDTGTIMTKIAQDAHLERVQRTNPDRVQLIQIEYARPNHELRNIFALPRLYHKNLCIAHQLGGIYEYPKTPWGAPDTNKPSVKVADTWDGFSGMGALVDVVGHTFVDRQNNLITPCMLVETCGYSLELEGKVLPNPNFQQLLQAINQEIGV